MNDSGPIEGFLGAPSGTRHTMDLPAVCYWNSQSL